MKPRKGSDGRDYAIGFEMRLPQAWNGRFYYQGNGGLDGAVQPAQGALGGGPLTGALAAGLRRHQFGRRPHRRGRPRSSVRAAGAARLRLPGRGHAHADGQGPDRDGLRQGAGPLLHRRLLQRRPPRDGGGRAPGRPVRRLPGRRARLPAAQCRAGPAVGRAAMGHRWPRRAPRSSTPSNPTASIPDLGSGLTAAGAPVVARAVARRNAMRWTVRATASVQATAACQAALRPGARCAHLQRRAQRPVPERARRSRCSRQCSHGGEDRRPDSDLRRLPL